MATTKILPPEILDFPLNNTSGTTLPTGIISIIADGGAPGGTGSSYVGGNGKVPPTGGCGGGGGDTGKGNDVVLVMGQRSYW